MSQFGAWKVDPILCPEGKLPQNLATGFAKVFENWAGTHFEPRIYCGTQLVNGTNHLLICVGTLPNVNEKSLAKIVLHETFPEEGQTTGNFSLMLIEEIIRGGEDGGWVFNPSLCEGGSLPQHLATGMPKLLKSFVGSKLEPLMFCGTQVVHGKNYMILCKQTLTTAEPEDHIVQVILHEKPVADQLVGEFSILAINRVI